MDSRKILEIYKLINDRSPKPVSAWPTIADIPHGVLVLDSDGVVKQKVGGGLVPVPITLVGSGPISSAPVASAANLGAMYLETGDPLWPNGRLYQSRYNGNMINNGLTAIADAVKPTRHIVVTSDFAIELQFYADPANVVAFTGLFSSGRGPGSLSTDRSFWIERDAMTTTYKVSVYDSAGTSKIISIQNVSNGYWHSIRVKKVGNLLTAYLNGVQAGTPQDLTGFVINDATNSSLFSQLSGRSFQGRVCCAKLIAETNGFNYDFNQTTGESISDRSGGANTGTLTDSTPASFWSIGWTPIQWPL